MLLYLKYWKITSLLFQRNFKFSISKSTLKTYTFLKYMIAANKKNFTFTITDEEIKKIKEYEKNKQLQKEDD